ncbi:MAG TPA: lipocalin family protein [Steroidobacteraceae bacterium]|nr:lipocalin family protein [Steroidobacteraceae bacterium]
MRPANKVVIIVSFFSLLAACRSSHAPITTAPHVDLSRFMGDWYVIANIPTRIERGAHNAMESYRLDSDGSIPTTFTFREEGFEGPVKRYCPRGFVRDTATNAVWYMQFVWPIKADYRIVFVSDDYQQTIVGREKRDNVWIMARTPQISATEFEDLRAKVASEGYDTSKLMPVPQQWPESAGAPPRSAGKECS